MLKVSHRPQWAHDITISVPVDGGFEEQTARVTYRLLDETAIEPTDANNPTAILRDVVVRMDDLADEAGKPLSWNDAVRDTLFAQPFVQAGLIKGYYRSVTGAASGNSDGLAAPGRRAS